MKRLTATISDLFGVTENRKRDWLLFLIVFASLC